MSNEIVLGMGLILMTSAFVVWFVDKLVSSVK